jgi:hypothetical protein
MQKYEEQEVDAWASSLLMDGVCCGFYSSPPRKKSKKHANAGSSPNEPIKRKSESAPLELGLPDIITRIEAIKHLVINYQTAKKYR